MTRRTTFTLHEAVRLLPSVVVAVMVVVPTATPFTVPDATLATPVALLVQVITWLLASAGRTTGLRASDSPTFTV